jgi:hypothetical protein
MIYQATKVVILHLPQILGNLINQIQYTKVLKFTMNSVEGVRMYAN